MSVIDTLIYDRTKSDVDRVHELAAKYPDWTSAESSEWFSGMKGAYNATDLNRVGEACNYIYQRLSLYGLAPRRYTLQKTDWAIADIPTREQFDTYITGVRTLKEAAVMANEIPGTLDGLDYNGANQIEKLLYDIQQELDSIENRLFFSGEYFSGEIYMDDRTSKYPGRYKLTPVAGEENTYDMTRADEPTDLGTPLNKANLLSDSTAALIGTGLGVSAPDTPDEAFEAIVNGVNAKITYGTVDLIPGESALDTGKVYLYYE